MKRIMPWIKNVFQVIISEDKDNVKRLQDIFGKLPDAFASCYPDLNVKEINLYSFL